jgi:hypothetical protein
VDVGNDKQHWWPEQPDFDFGIQDANGDTCRDLASAHRDRARLSTEDRNLERQAKLGQSGAMAEVPSPA